jgi:penicillin-binding protein 2
MVRGVRIKDHYQEQRLFDTRAIVAGCIIALLTAALFARLFTLQVIKYAYYTDLAQGNRIKIEPIPAARGLIMDRKGEVLAANQPAYQLELTLEQVTDLDKELNGLMALGLLGADEVPDLKRAIRSRRKFDSVPVRLRMNEEDIARFAVRRFEFPGVDIKTRQTRFYPNGQLGVHALGYVSAISETDLKKIDRNAYAGTSLIGKLGIESAFEPKLHGTNGFREILVNATGRSVQRQGALMRDLRTQAPVAGEDLILALDFNVQRVAEQELGARRGAVVAIDPENGDIIALVSRPGFDPSLFGRGLTKAEYAALRDDVDLPLINRALRGTYPSGSTIKPGLALAGLVDHAIGADTIKFCPGIYRLPGSSRIAHEARVGGRHGSVDMRDAIARSCDVYFYDLANVLGVDQIASFLHLFGFGEPTGIDIGGEKSGLLPSKEWKRRAFSRPADQVWYPGETINFGVGQGYFLVTPLQLAHYTTMLANRGRSYRPRLVTATRDPLTGAIHKIAPIKNPEEITTASPQQWQVIMEGMAGTLRGRGTAAAIAGRNMTYTIAGKTGTAQVFSLDKNEKYDEKKLQERLRDHSWFVAFAPAEAPRIAIAVLVENGGYGSTGAAPIARKVMDAYLVDDQGKLKVPLPPGTLPLLPRNSPTQAHDHADEEPAD